MNLASILVKKVLIDSDVETWAALRRDYFPKEYHRMYSLVEKHLELYGTLPSFEDLKLSIRDANLREQLYAIELSDEVDIACDQLLEYLKNQYAQLETINLLEQFLESSIATSTAEEIVDYIQGIVLELEEKIELHDDEENMQRISLFETTEILERTKPLGLNNEYDSTFVFGPGDLVLIGGKRGHGKSIVCANIAANAYDDSMSSIYFTIEMNTREILQRMCSISTGVPNTAIMHKNLSISEWEKVASWWAKRYEAGEETFNEYLKHRSFEELHKNLIQKPLRETQLDIVHDSALSLTRIRTELDKKIKTLKPHYIIVDYINQVERLGRARRVGQYDWTEQIEISKALKKMATDYGVILVAPYQIDASGEARFAKGILDAPSAAYTIDYPDKESSIIEFKCSKMRNAPETGFISTINWASLKIGPDTGYIPGEEEPTGEEAQEI